ncbi:MAG TPA: barstar family protein [Ruminococcus sp.]|nr:barstar family protein [Ruminococcus sp.]
MRTYIIDGSKFYDFEGFCCEIDRILTKGLSFKTGHNLNAFRDILYGGFGCHEPEEPFVIKWLHYEKSRANLGDILMLAILDNITDHDNSGYDCKLEIYR